MLEIKVKLQEGVHQEFEFIEGKSNWIDLRTAERIKMNKGDFKLIPLGFALELPEGFEAHILPRSSPPVASAFAAAPAPAFQPATPCPGRCATLSASGTSPRNPRTSRPPPSAAAVRRWPGSTPSGTRQRTGARRAQCRAWGATGSGRLEWT